MELTLNLNDVADYRTFLKVKSLPKYEFRGRVAVVPDEYAHLLGKRTAKRKKAGAYAPMPFLFDYQRDIAALAIRKRKFAVFADCGLGKCLISLEYARHVAGLLPKGRNVLIVSPLMVVRQTLAEARQFYGDGLAVEQVAARDLAGWLKAGSGRIGITNYDGLNDDTPQGRLGCLILDESSMLKSAYGKWGKTCVRLGRGLDWKLCLTGTPAPNDRIEFANHAVFLDAFPTVNSFLAKFFINRGQTENRWEIKPHAVAPFYRALSHWSIFVTNPGTYGWKDNAGTLPPIHTHIHDVDLTDSQAASLRGITGELFANNIGGIASRAKVARIAKLGDSKKPAFIRDLIGSWSGSESTLVWCRFNDEQDLLAREIPGAASIQGSTPNDERERIITDFQAGRVRTVVTKARLLGFGLNMQVATRQVFSSLHDSWEEFYQAVKRSNRVGSTKPLNVHIPITEAERPMLDSVLRKAGRVDADTTAQERIFRENSLDFRD